MGIRVCKNCKIEHLTTSYDRGRPLVPLVNHNTYAEAKAYVKEHTGTIILISKDGECPKCRGYRVRNERSLRETGYSLLEIKKAKIEIWKSKSILTLYEDFMKKVKANKKAYKLKNSSNSH